MKRLICIASLLFVSCATAEKSGDLPKPEFRYLNLRLVAETLSGEDREWKTNSTRIKDLSARLEKIGTNSTGDQSSERMLIDNELREIRKKNDDIRKRILLLIDRAVKEVATRESATIVFNASDSVLYADPKYDITGEVIAEARSLRMRNDFLSR
jgi:Skp family chaperone for outer membrane proteins